MEEEFALLDPASGKVVPVAAEVIRACADPAGVVAEFMRYMVETRTPVCETLDDVTQALAARRARAVAAARLRGTLLVASGVAPFGVPDPPPVTDDPRYAALSEAFPFAMRTTGTCACHVHVAVPDSETGTDVLRRLRRWLPALAALTANSPIWEGRDVGWASSRYIFVSRWPTATPAPPSRSAAEYHEVVRAAVAAGAAIDRRSVYFLARLSPRHPTVEVRIADTCLTVDEAVAYAGLVRAMVGQALADAACRRPPPTIPQPALVAACRAAARVGLVGRLRDASTGRERRVWDYVDALVASVLPTLERYGDADRVLTTLDRLRLVGSGAERQRRMLAESPAPKRFVAALAEATTDRLDTGLMPKTPGAR